VPRIARVVVPGVLHHVTQRGNNRQDVFLTDSDREFYLGLLRKRSGQYGLDVLGYCLMTNHVHLLVRPQTAQSLAQALGRTHFIYAQRFNAEHSRSGHLWQARFYSCPAEEAALLAVMRYIEQNPVRAGIVTHAWEYPWSSAAAHVGRRKDSGLVDTGWWAAQISAAEWRKLLEGAEDPERVTEIRRRTMIGRPLGSPEFVNEIEARLYRQLTCRPPGRPRKIRTE
jgi:putative transposase